MASTCCGGPRKISGSGRKASCCGETDHDSESSAACCAQEQTAEEPCGCASDSARFGEKWVAGRVVTPVGDVPIAATKLTFSDRFGSWKCRWSIGRMDYKVEPGLYGVGQPDASSPVLVTSNYKMTFDRLREQLGGLNLWIVVLDTDGVNVWCAAGKGTFHTR